MDDPEAAKLVGRLVGEVKNPSKACMVHQETKLANGVSQWLVVIENDSYRFSIYYQATDNYSNIATIDFEKKLSVYIRPVGTTSMDSVDIICDYYANGSWDRAWINGQEMDGEYLLYTPAYDKEQSRYIAFLNLALAKFAN